ncbi:HD domain-containing protein [Candidatus Woesearchaeota archaeon]|nr:HD domain-containing protein [Candidatus Woesearchaeota archaeon]
MENLNKLRRFYHLKHVERATSVLNRKESSAEHSWSTLILADYFLSIMKDKKIDRLKVYELLMYHDVVEIEAGDVPIHHEEERKNKKAIEKEAMKKLKEEFPEAMKEKVWDLFVEFEERETKEAKFAKAIDRIDSLIHELDYKKDWKGWTEEMVERFHGPDIKEVPLLEEAFNKLLKHCNQEGYFNQSK